jgi:polysaccharide biosynthesis transport protein
MRTPVGKLKQPIAAETAAPAVPSVAGLDRFHGPVVYGVPEEKVEYLTLLRRHRFAVVLIFLFCLLCGALYAHFAPKSYQVQTVLEITGFNENFLNIRDVDPSAGGVAPDSYLETQIKLLQNEVVVDRVVEVMTPAVPSSLASDDQAKELVIRNMLLGARAKEEGQSKLVRITLNGPDPKLAADTANELTAQYIQEGQDARLNAASQTGVFLRQRLEDAKNNLKKSEDILQEYTRASGIVLTNEDHETVSADHLRQIQDGLAQAQLDRAIRQSQMELARKTNIDSVPQVLDDPTVREDRIRLTDLRRQLAELSTTMTPSNYRVQKIQAQIQDLEAEMERHRFMILNRLTVEDRTAARREELLQKQYQQQLAVVTDQGSKQVHFNMLKHDVDVNLEIYHSMLQRAKEAEVMAALHAANARVVNPAKVPFLPYSPKLYICVLLATLAGTVLSALYILICERKDNSVRNPGQSERYIERPELAVIPRIRLVSKPSKSSLKLTTNNGNGSKHLHPLLEHWKEKNKTFLAEAYRSAGASILFSRNGPVSPKVLLVTSPHPQCGKTTTTANLAVSLAEGGRSVLLIDGDLRRPALAEIFGVQNGEGLVNTLDESERADPYTLIRSTPFPGVRVLAGGAVKVSIAKLLHSSRLGLVLDRLRDEFDFILIDAPPLLGLADARILGKFADGVILVCRAGHTSVDDLEETRRLLVEDGTHILGTILNGYDLQRERSAHYNSYLKYIGKTPA